MQYSSGTIKLMGINAPINRVAVSKAHEQTTDLIICLCLLSDAAGGGGGGGDACSRFGLHCPNRLTLRNHKSGATIGIFLKNNAFLALKES